MSERNKINGWRCDECGFHTYAIHVDDGVTPMFLTCRALPSCKGRAVSLMYPAPPAPEHVVKAVAWEWYRPSRKAIRSMSSSMRDHIERGGLDLRPLTDAGRKALKAMGVSEIAP